VHKPNDSSNLRDKETIYMQLSNYAAQLESTAAHITKIVSMNY
jgi:hypothetical protein